MYTYIYIYICKYIDVQKVVQVISCECISIIILIGCTVNGSIICDYNRTSYINTIMVRQLL